MVVLVVLVTVVITWQIVESFTGELADQLDQDTIVENLIAVTGEGGGYQWW